MFRKKEADCKAPQPAGETNSASNMNVEASGLVVGPHASSRQGIMITKATRMNFLSKEGKHSTDSDSGNAKKPATEEAPERETQLERKRRLNRNNERKKRAKRIFRIEELTLKFHSLTSQNEALRAESQELKEKIDSVKRYLKEQGRSKPAANVQSEISLPRSPQESFATAPMTGLLSSTRQDREPPIPDVTSMALVRALSSGGQSLTRGTPAVDLSFIPREQRIRLLQLEFEKQERIITQLRIQSGIAAAVPAITAAATPAVAPINDQEQNQMLIRRAAETATASQLPGLEGATNASSYLMLGSASQSRLTYPNNLMLQLQDVHSTSRQSGRLSTVASAPTSGPFASIEGGLAMNDFLQQQQFLLALEAMQNQKRSNHGG